MEAAQRRLGSASENSGGRAAREAAQRWRRGRTAAMASHLSACEDMLRQRQRKGGCADGVTAGMRGGCAGAGAKPPGCANVR